MTSSRHFRAGSGGVAGFVASCLGLHTEARQRGVSALLVVLLFAGVLGNVFTARSEAAGGYNASGVLGQVDGRGNDSYTNGFRQGQVGMKSAWGTAYDSVSNTLFASDGDGCRVLAYSVDPATGRPDQLPFAVLGQPDFDTHDCTAAQNRMYSPTGLALDESGRRLFVSEYMNYRVSVWDIATVTTGENAINVLGTPNFTTRSSSNGQAGLSSLFDLAYDPDTSYLYVGDDANNRVMVFDVASITDGENAAYVVGQPNFSTYTSGTTSQKLNRPQGLALDTAANRLFVADSSNSRVTAYDVTTPASNLAATNVFGRPNLTTSGALQGQTGFSSPQGLGVDPTRKRLYVGDSQSNRVLVFDYASIIDNEPAIYVIGQSDFTTYSAGTSRNQVREAVPVSYNAESDVLYAGDDGNNRFLVFSAGFSTNQPSAIDALGNLGEDGLVDYTDGADGEPTTGWGVNQPGSVVVDSAEHRLFIADTENHRVLIHKLDDNNRLIDRRADWVLGQPDFNSKTPRATQSGMNTPVSIAYDSTNRVLWVADALNNRVLSYDLWVIDNGENATTVLGQTNYTNSGSGLTQSTLNFPLGVAVDPPTSRLFVSDANNHRVLVFDVATVTNGENAVNRLGQSSYTANSTGVTTTTFNGPRGLVYDQSTGRLYVSDMNNNRVKVFDATSITNNEATVASLGQPNDTTSSSGLTAAKMNAPSGVAIDSANQRLFVSERGNHRVTAFDVTAQSTGESAIRVFGQPNLTTNTAELTRDGLYQPAGVAYDPASAQIFVPQKDGTRVSVFDVDTHLDTVLPASLPRSQAYSKQLVGTNPNGTNSFAVTAGALPTGLSLSSGGLISGTPTAAGNYNFTITVTNTGSGHGTLYGAKTYAIEVTGPVYNATSVLGQYYKEGSPAWDTNAYNSQNGMNEVLYSAYHHNTQTMFVVDGWNNRVFAYSVDPGTGLPDMQPYAVLGQTNFNDRTPGLAADKFDYPQAVVVDPVRNLLFVSEWNNKRVMVFDISSRVSTGQSAINVLGKPDFTTNTGDGGANGIGNSWPLAYDADRKRLFVGDEQNNRVLVFDTTYLSNGMPASKVIGQPDFWDSTAGPTQSRLVQANGLAYDSTQQRLFVSDQAHRVLVFDVNDISNGEPAVNILGKAAYNNGSSGFSQSAMNQPAMMAVDEARSRLLVADVQNARTLVFDVATITNGENAVYVLGQPDFTTNSQLTTQSKLGSTGWGTSYFPEIDRIAVADSYSHRLMIFDGNITANGPNALTAIGHELSDGSPNWTDNSSDWPSRTDFGLEDPYGMTIDHVNHRMFIADWKNNRVVIHQLDSNNKLIDRHADWVLGHSTFNQDSDGTSQNTLAGPTGVAYDSGQDRLYVADSHNHRVLVFDVATITNGENAIYVLGQTNYTNSSTSTARNRMNGPYGISVDEVNHRLFVGDSGNNRILVWNTGSLSNGKNADNQLGQSVWGSVGSAASQSGLNVPSTSAYDSTTSRLYVTDEQNERVVVYDVASITDGENAVNVLGQTTWNGSTGGLSASKVASELYGLAIDTVGQRLFVNDSKNHRVLIFDVASITNGEDAVRVLGQTNFASNSAGLSQSKLNEPFGVAYDSTNHLLHVSDSSNHRIVAYDIDTVITTNSLAQATNGASYSQQLSASNPNGTTAYSVTGGSLPPGLSLGSGGAITGTPSGASGTYNFTVTASTTPEEHGTLTGSKALSISIANGAPNPPSDLRQTKTDTTPISGTTLYDFPSDQQGWTSYEPTTPVSYHGAIGRTAPGSIAINVDDSAATEYGGYLTDAQWTPRSLDSPNQYISAWLKLSAGATGTGWTGQVGVIGPDASTPYWGSAQPLSPDKWTRVWFQATPELLRNMTAIQIWVANNDHNMGGDALVYVDDVQQGTADWTNESSVRFAASVSDTDGSDNDQLCVEVKAVGSAFTDTEDSCGSLTAYAGSPVTASHTIGSLVSGTQYHWQARTRDAAGAYSAWVQYGGDLDTLPASPDFAVDTTAPVATWAKDGPTLGVDSSLNDGSLDTLSVNAELPTDSQSGVMRVEYSFGTSPGATDVKGWTRAAVPTPTTGDGLTLRTGQTYYANVRFVDTAGNVSNVVSSNGQSVAPTLTFGVSTNELVFDALFNGNGYAPPTQSLDITTSTNAYSGYVVRQYNSGLLTSNGSTIPAYSGAYASPTTWTGTGFGYTSSDTSIQSAGNIFLNATRYAGLTTTAPGDIVADHVATVSGSPITNETFSLTYKVVSTPTSPAGTYTTTLNLGATALY